VITGYILTGIPYGIGLLAAVGSNFTNKSGYLLVPWAGPWLTLGLRDSRCEDLESESDFDEAASDTWGCTEDAMVDWVLVMDGIIQAAGGAVLLAGYLATSPKLVRNEPGFALAPAPVGSGYGLSALGSF
jgi:hypothetical protein